MGVTSKSIERLQTILARHQVKSVCDLGAQNDYRDEIIRTNPKVYPFISEWWRARGVEYTSIDLSEQNGAIGHDLSTIISGFTGPFDMVCDFGTSEHVENYYNCNWNIHTLCKPGGLIVKENPLVGNWPGHGLHYVDEKFYEALAGENDYKILELGREAAMGNFTDGWNVVVVMQKLKDNIFCLPSDFPAVTSFVDDTYNRSQKGLWKS